MAVDRGKPSNNLGIPPGIELFTGLSFRSPTVIKQKANRRINSIGVAMYCEYPGNMAMGSGDHR